MIALTNHPSQIELSRVQNHRNNWNRFGCRLLSNSPMEEVVHLRWECRPSPATFLVQFSVINFPFDWENLGTVDGSLRFAVVGSAPLTWSANGFYRLTYTVNGVAMSSNVVYQSAAA